MGESVGVSRGRGWNEDCISLVFFQSFRRTGAGFRDFRNDGFGEMRFTSDWNRVQVAGDDRRSGQGQGRVISLSPTGGDRSGRRSNTRANVGSRRWAGGRNSLGCLARPPNSKLAGMQNGCGCSKGIFPRTHPKNPTNGRVLTLLSDAIPRLVMRGRS